MKKIPTLFAREFLGRGKVRTLPYVTPGMEWVLEGKGVATVKIDGACCAIIDGKFYKRYDAKWGKTPPAGAIPCCDPDPVTGHWPHWVAVDKNDPGDKWFVEAYRNSVTAIHVGLPDVEPTLTDWTYEAVGPHFQGNPYKITFDMLVPHGSIDAVNVTPTFEGIRKWLEENNEEGLVFWLDGEPRCKIKRTDFGFEWPVVGK